MGNRRKTSVSFWEADFFKDKRAEDAGFGWSEEVYSNQLIHRIIKNNITLDGNKKIIEIGCYPGSKLLWFYNEFKCRIYGIEYIKKLADITHENFRKRKIDATILHRDFFNKSFHKEYKNFFDLVLDYGFLEHFTNSEEIIQKYYNLLRRRGHIVLIIPNLGGVYGFLMYLLSKSTLAAHNTKIMDKRILTQLFEGSGFSTAYSGYVGKVYMDNSSSSTLDLLAKNRCFNSVIRALFTLLNKTLKVLPFPETRGLSPYIMYVGVKR